MIGLTSSSSSLLRNAMLRHPSMYLLRTMSSVQTASTTSEHLHYGNNPTGMVMDDILVNHQRSPQQQHGTWQRSSNENTTNTVAPSTTYEHLKTSFRRTHINSTASNPNGAYVLFPL